MKHIIRINQSGDFQVELPKEIVIQLPDKAREQINEALKKDQQKRYLESLSFSV